MLVLTRKPRQQIMIGDNIVVNIVEVQGDNVRIAIDASRSTAVKSTGQSRRRTKELQKVRRTLTSAACPKGKIYSHHGRIQRKRRERFPVYTEGYLWQ